MTNQVPEVAVLVRRGDHVESRHRASFVIARPDGDIVAAGGDLGHPVFPRSAVKPLQAIALVESGAADAFGLSERELALASASHGGEPVHVDLVQRWLARLGLDSTALECGTHRPLDPESTDRLLAAGAAPTPLHHNCSGKHAGMLTLALHLGVPTAGYIRPDHRVQIRISGVLRDMAGLEALPRPAVDGCGVPTHPLPLPDLARALARFARPDDLPPARAAACRRLQRAIMAHPELVAGTGRPDTAILRALPGIVVKTGAEGVYAAALPAQGLGLVLKVDDGGMRAVPVALLALLDALGALDDRARRALAEVARPEVRNPAGRVVGGLDVAPGWPDLGSPPDIPTA